jgi:hypothetical protein
MDGKERWNGGDVNDTRTACRVWTGSEREERDTLGGRDEYTF